MEDRQLSENFKFSEFGAVPTHDLLELLQSLRKHLGRSIEISDGAREIKDHIDIYKKLHGQQWLEVIPWDSRHLPTFKDQGYLRAVDIKVRKILGDMSQVVWLSGAELKEHIQLIRNSEFPNLKLGLGIGSNFLHVDTDRTADTEWKYNY